MPTYVYACTNPDCAHQFEAVQAFTDDALTVCPVCGERLRKVFGSVGVVFKGAGFYRNDSREKAAAGATSSAPQSGSDKNGAKSEGGKPESAGSKPDAAPASMTESGASSGAGRPGSNSGSAASNGSRSAATTSSDRSATAKS